MGLDILFDLSGGIWDVLGSLQIAHRGVEVRFLRAMRAMAWCTGATSVHAEVRVPSLAIVT